MPRFQAHDLGIMNAQTVENGGPNSSRLFPFWHDSMPLSGTPLKSKESEDCRTTWKHKQEMMYDYNAELVEVIHSTDYQPDYY